MTINQENLALLRAALVKAEADDQFDINSFRHECGSPACIVGWVTHLRDPKDHRDHQRNQKENAAWLGVTEFAIEKIYIGWVGFDWANPTTGNRTASTPPFSAVLAFLDIMHDQNRVPYWREVQ